MTVRGTFTRDPYQRHLVSTTEWSLVSTQVPLYLLWLTSLCVTTTLSLSQTNAMIFEIVALAGHTRGTQYAPSAVKTLRGPQACAQGLREAVFVVPVLWNGPLGFTCRCCVSIFFKILSLVWQLVSWRDFGFQMTTVTECCELLYASMWKLTTCFGIQMFHFWLRW